MIRRKESSIIGVGGGHPPLNYNRILRIRISAIIDVGDAPLSYNRAVRIPSHL